MLYQTLAEPIREAMAAGDCVISKVDVKTRKDGVEFTVFECEVPYEPLKDMLSNDKRFKDYAADVVLLRFSVNEAQQSNPEFDVTGAIVLEAEINNYGSAYAVHYFNPSKLVLARPENTDNRNILTEGL